jgi:hypothetical protein
MCFGIWLRIKRNRKKKKKVELPSIVDVFVIFLSMDAFLFE